MMIAVIIMIMMIIKGCGVSESELQEEREKTNR